MQNCVRRALLQLYPRRLHWKFEKFSGVARRRGYSSCSRWIFERIIRQVNRPSRVYLYIFPYSILYLGELHWDSSSVTCRIFQRRLGLCLHCEKAVLSSVLILPPLPFFRVSPLSPLPPHFYWRYAKRQYSQVLLSLLLFHVLGSRCSPPRGLVTLL